ncbi:MAG: SDR family oxidoreductase [Candidatus Gastranaerophilales bacterium]|nr:SDR family oxidoreductase [Candidatus Gastranaerophilales bacterium]
MKKILITGGAGFIGSHLCEKLLNEGNEVICLDNFFTGSKDNIYNLMDNKKFELIRHDIIKPLLIEVDEIYNLACPASPIHYQHNAIKTIKTNVLGIINVLGLAKRLHVPILQASTSEVYGDPIVHPQREDYWGNVNPIGIRSCYDEGKRVAETLMMDYHRQNKVDIKIIRIFNTYGPRMAEDDGRVVSNFITQALRNQDITVYGEGNQTRSFCYVSDLVDGMVKMMNSDREIIGPINLGNNTETPIIEFARRIIDITCSKSKIIHLPLPQDDPVRRCPDLTLAKTKLGWDHKVKLDDGLKETIKYFENKLRNEKKI